MFLQLLYEKSIIFSDVSLPRLCKSMTIALQNITESPKKDQLTMSKHSEKFSFKLEKYSNT